MAKNVYLIGPMGCGKSRVGRALAAELGRPFIDTDAEIERRARSTVAKLFERRGEAAFRRLERAAVRAACAGRGQVVALGGGAPMQAALWPLLAKTGTTVRLTCDQKALWRRLARERAARPLLRGGTPAESRRRFAALLRARRAAYPKGKFQVSTTRLSPRDAARLIARRLKSENLSRPASQRKGAG